MSSIVLLGSTGSIGVNTLIVAKRYNIRIEALVAGSNIDLLNRQIAEHKPKFIVIANETDKHKVKEHTEKNPRKEAFCCSSSKSPPQNYNNTSKEHKGRLYNNS